MFDPGLLQKKGITFGTAIFLFLSILSSFVDIGKAQQWTPPKGDYPAPRYPEIPEITTVEELMPYVRHIITRKGAEHLNEGYEIKGGERILFIARSAWDPLVIEAFVRAFREMKCHVDVVIRQSDVKPLDIHAMGEAESMERKVAGELSRAGLPAWLVEAAKNYDWAVGASGVPNSARFQWPIRELVASDVTMFPDELLDVIDQKMWEVIRQAEEIHIVDPEGTDLRRTWFQGYWQVIEGSHPTVKTIGENFGGYAAGQKIGATYGPGQSEKPMIRVHITGVPQGVVLEQSNGEGVAGSTAAHQGPSPWIRLTVKDNQIAKVEGGGRYGEAWGEYIEEYKNVHYPLYPRPGVGWFVEAAIGTHPKVFRPHNVMESVAGRANWAEERRRSGVIHLGFGETLWENKLWGAKENMPTGHHHLHLYFPTVTVRMRDGKEVVLVDKGHLTVLDHPEVRRVAAKYGDPDQLLKEDWIPAIPGINTEGDYWRDYAQDPWSWIEKEHRKAYGDLLDFEPYP